MKLTEREFTALIKMSITGNMVMARFGPGGVWLDDTPENQWAIGVVKEMRAKDQEAQQEPA